MMRGLPPHLQAIADQFDNANADVVTKFARTRHEFEDEDPEYEAMKAQVRAKADQLLREMEEAEEAKAKAAREAEEEDDISFEYLDWKEL